MSEILFGFFMTLELVEGFRGLDDGGIEISRVLEISGGSVVIINISETKTDAKSISPLKVI